MISDIPTSVVGAKCELIAALWLMNHGYEVFRNVAPVGPVDLVGLKDGKTELFDVKLAYRNADNLNIYPKLSDKQKALGVKCLCVFPDDSCEIDIEADGLGACKECGAEFKQKRRWERRQFCSSICSSRNYKKRKRSGVDADATQQPLV